MTDPVQYHDPLPKCVKKHLDYDLEQLKKVPLTYASTAYRGKGTSHPSRYSERLLKHKSLEPNTKALPKESGLYLLSWSVPSYLMSLVSIKHCRFSALKKHWQAFPTKPFIIKNAECLYQPLSVVYYSKINFTVLFVAALTLPFLILIEPDYNITFAFSFILALCITAVLWIIRLMLKSAGDTNTPTYKFDRATGRVYLIGELHTLEYSFSEITPLFSVGFSPRLYLEFDEKTSMNFGKATPQSWEFLKHFMDVTLPLPDIPELEPLRAYDETTIAWDKENNRPPELYKNMTVECYKTLEERVKIYQHIVSSGSESINTVQKIWTLLHPRELGLPADLWSVIEIPHT